MRDDMKEGEKSVIIKNKDQLIFARRTEEALKRYEKGKFIEMDFDEFMQEAKTW